MALLHFLVDPFFPLSLVVLLPHYVLQQIGNNGWPLCRGHIITIITGARSGWDISLKGADLSSCWMAWPGLVACLLLCRLDKARHECRSVVV